MKSNVVETTRLPRPLVGHSERFHAKRGPHSSGEEESIRIGINTRTKVLDYLMDGVSSGGQRNSLGERLRWCHPTERLSRPRVERAGDGIKLSLCGLGEV